jgi:hypothetical protein
VVGADEDCSSEGKAEAVGGGVRCGDALGRVLKGYMWWQHEKKPRGSSAAEKVVWKRSEPP